MDLSKGSYPEAMTEIEKVLPPSCPNGTFSGMPTELTKP
jgi:hypothetical protein